MAKNRTLNVNEATIAVIHQNETDYISLTDITISFKEGSGLIGKWITNKNTLEYLGVWEKINNPNFNYPEFGVIGQDVSINNFSNILHPIHNTMQKILSLFFLILSTSIFSQEYLNKNDNYDLKVFKYLDSLTVTDKISLNDYLTFSKPFSKWDIRPVNSDKIWSLDSIRTSSEISNFFWGGFCQNYELSQKAAGDKANQFINQGLIDEKSNVTFLNNNLSKFKEICSLLEKSKNLIFLNQNSLQRVDSVFKENRKYWSYVIPKKSPFPISTHIRTEKKHNFSSLNRNILEKMKEINIYAIVKTEKGIFLLIDGFTDNSYGFYFSKSNTIEKNNHLFEIMKFESIKNNFFYYIAN